LYFKKFKNLREYIDYLGLSKAENGCNLSVLKILCKCFSKKIYYIFKIVKKSSKGLRNLLKIAIFAPFFKTGAKKL